jgi:hypothetical protein
MMSHITEFFAGTTSANIALLCINVGFFLANKANYGMIGKIIDKLELIMTDLDDLCGGVHEETASDVASESECETDKEQQSESEVDAKKAFVENVVEIKMAHISWNVCTPLSDALKYDIYNREMDSMTMEDFDELVFERTPKGYVTLIIDLGGVRKDCQLQTPATTEDVMDRLAAFFHEPLDAEDIEEYKKHTTVDDDFDETSMCKFERNIYDAGDSYGWFQFCGLIREDKYVYHVDLRKSDVF